MSATLEPRRRRLIGGLIACAAILGSHTQAQSPRENAQAAFDRGYRYQTGRGIKKDLRLALEAYREAIKQDPSYSDAYYNMAQISFDIGRYDVAVWGYKNYIKYNPGDAQAIHDLGVVYNMQGEYDLAIQQYRKALSLNPNLSQAHYNLGNVYYALKKQDLAIREWDIAIQMDPEKEAYVNRRERFARIERQKKGLFSPRMVGGFMWGLLGVFVVYSVIYWLRRRRRFGPLARR